jgi:hypothetical protein
MSMLQGYHVFKRRRMSLNDPLLEAMGGREEKLLFVVMARSLKRSPRRVSRCGVSIHDVARRTAVLDNVSLLYTA